MVCLLNSMQVVEKRYCNYNVFDLSLLPFIENDSMDVLIVHSYFIACGGQQQNEEVDSAGEVVCRVTVGVWLILVVL